MDSSFAYLAVVFTTLPDSEGIRGKGRSSHPALHGFLQSGQVASVQLEIDECQVSNVSITSTKIVEIQAKHRSN